MASAKLFLDTRHERQDHTYPIIIRLSCNRRTTAIPMNISIPKEMWVKGKFNMEVKKSFPHAALINADLLRSISKVNDCILQLKRTGKLDSMTVKELKEYIINSSKGTREDSGKKESTGTNFVNYFREVMNLIDNDRTRELYSETLKKVVKYSGEDLTFEEINVHWLKMFNNYLKSSCPSVNARSIHLRNIRKVFNSALDDDLVSVYPFRKYKIESKKESDTMPLSIDQMIAIRDYKSTSKTMEMARDIFMITFYLIGINSSDLYNLKKGERCTYTRNKTGKKYDIGLQPEALEMIEKYKDDNMMFNFHKIYGDAHSMNSRVNQNLKKIGKEIGEPSLKLYHARHTHATLARKILHVSKEDVAQMLGHGSFDVTDVYARYDSEQIDKNNRMVLDLLKKAK
ncbi:site-specific integrase [Butyricimonas faecihominis]|uniref:site-specific integrase n=1 Tax=Butyricimonas faecihominis TaxID=1472416 RepID=UPI00205E6E33|nr:site-specific integrase [Butyricimonas faecihominis]DAS27089.1 MAG TPA: Integrase [Caudoviricetes sp.]